MNNSYALIMAYSMGFVTLNTHSIIVRNKILAFTNIVSKSYEKELKLCYSTSPIYLQKR